MSKWAVLWVLVALVAAGFYFGYKKFNVNSMPETDLFSKAQIAASRGNHEKAIEYYHVLLKKDPRHSTALEFMARSYYQTKDFRAAIEAMESAFRLEPTQRNRDFLAFLYDSSGQKEKAIVLREAKTPPPSKHGTGQISRPVAAPTQPAPVASAAKSGPQASAPANSGSSVRVTVAGKTQTVVVTVSADQRQIEGSEFYHLVHAFKPIHCDGCTIQKIGQDSVKFSCEKPISELNCTSPKGAVVIAR